jgi:hypothetical protein
MIKLKFLLFLLLLLVLGCGEPKEEILFSVRQQSGAIKAEIVEVQGWWLFSDECFLQIVDSSRSSSLRTDYDLHDSYGGYESGVMKVRWLSEDTLLIESNRFIGLAAEAQNRYTPSTLTGLALLIESRIASRVAMVLNPSSASGWAVSPLARQRAKYSI